MLLRPSESKAFQVSTGSGWQSQALFSLQTQPVVFPRWSGKGGGEQRTRLQLPSPIWRAVPRIALVVKGQVVGLTPERYHWAEAESQLRRQYHFSAPPFHRQGNRPGEIKCMCVSCSVVSNSLQPHGAQSTRLLCPWDFPGKNTGVSCHFLLQGIFLTQGSNPGLRLCRQTLHHLSHQRSPSSQQGRDEEVCQKDPQQVSGEAGSRSLLSCCACWPHRLGLAAVCTGVRVHDPGNRMANASLG